MQIQCSRITQIDWFFFRCQTLKKRKLLLYQLAPTVGEETLRSFLSNFGELQSLVLFDYQDRDSRLDFKFAFVEYVHKKSVSSIFNGKKEFRLNQQKFKIVSWAHRQKVQKFLQAALPYLDYTHEDSKHMNEFPWYKKSLKKFAEKQPESDEEKLYPGTSPEHYRAEIESLVSHDSKSPPQIVAIERFLSQGSEAENDSFDDEDSEAIKQREETDRIGFQMLQLNNQLSKLKQKSSNARSDEKALSGSRAAKKDQIMQKSIRLCVTSGVADYDPLSKVITYSKLPGFHFKKSDYITHYLEDKRGDQNLRMNALLPKKQLQKRSNFAKNKSQTKKIQH